MSGYLPSIEPRNATEVSDVDLGTAYPHNIMSIPTFRLSTYNLRTYSSFAYASKARRRHRRVKTNLREILRCSDVVVVQETKLQAPDFYHEFQDEWVVFCNPYYKEDFYTDTEEENFIGTDTESDYCSSEEENRWEDVLQREMKSDSCVTMGKSTLPKRVPTFLFGNHWPATFCYPMKYTKWDMCTQ